MGVSKWIFIFGWTFLLIPWQTVTLSDKENHVYTSPLCAITLFHNEVFKGQTSSWFSTEFHLFLAFCLSLPPLLYVTNRVRASQLRAALWRRSAKRGSLVKLKCLPLRIDNADDEQSGGKQEEKRATVRNETSPKPNEIFWDFHKESSCSLSLTVFADEYINMWNR